VTDLPKHSPFGASKAKQWMACPGSVKAQEGLPQVPSPWAEEGTKLHDVAAKCLELFVDDHHEWLAPTHGLSAEQSTVVTAYVMTILGDLQYTLGKSDKIYIEERVRIETLHPLFYGTADCITVRDGKLTVYDLKCGAGVNVEVEDHEERLNPQLAYYMMGAINALGGEVKWMNIHLPHGVESLEIVVVQPRLGGVKRRLVSVVELLDLAFDMVQASDAVDRYGAMAMQKAGDHCRFCLAKPTCPTLKAHVREAARLEFAEPADLPRDDLADLLNQASLIEAWIEAVREYAKQEVSKGATIPGWIARGGRGGHRKWSDPETAKALLIEWGLDEDQIAPRKLVSPAEVERLAKLHDGVGIMLDDMVERPPPVVTMTRTDAKTDFQKEDI
jgi:hypothetical protein